MAIKVGVLITQKFRGRVKVCPDMADGIARTGDKVIKLRATEYTEPFSDVLVHYGFDGDRDSKIAKAHNDYKCAGLKAVYIDLGYWNNRARDGRYGYHRFSIDSRHPTEYFQRIKHPPDRAAYVGVKLSTYKIHGSKILLCGMSDKCARFEGFTYEEWERQAIEKLRAATDRPIVYRPKPRRSREPQAPPIKGVGYSDPSRTRLEQELGDAWAVVSHHSNAGIDALLAGVPSFSDEGVATVLGHTDLALIEQPRCPSLDERKQFVYDVAYCQFNRPEMRAGVPWRHFKDEGLVP